MRLSGGEHQSFKIGDSQELDQRRSEMHGLLHSTSGMPHLEQSSSFRETISAAGDKKVLPSLVLCQPLFKQLSSRIVRLAGRCLRCCCAWHEHQQPWPNCSTLLLHVSP